MTDARPALSRRARLHWDRARSAHVLLVPEGVLHLNEQAAEVLALCDGARSEADVVRALAERYPDAPVEALTEDVSELLNRLRTRGFVQDKP